MAPTPSRILSGFVPFLAAVLLHALNPTAFGQDTSGGTLVIHTGTPPSLSPPPPTLRIDSVILPPIDPSEVSLIDTLLAAQPSVGSVTLTTTEVPVGNLITSAGSISLVGGTTYASGSSASSVLVIGGGSLTQQPNLEFLDAQGISTSLSDAFTLPTWYTIVGPGTLLIRALTYSYGSISGSSYLRVLTPYLTSSTSMAVEARALVINEMYLGGTEGSQTFPDKVLALGPFSKVIVIRPPGYQPPQPPPPPVIPNQPPVANSRTIVHASPAPLTISPSSLATDPEGDYVTFTLSMAPEFGSVSIEYNQIIYTPSENYFSGDSFKLQCSDRRGGIAESTIVLTNPFGTIGGSYFGVVPDRGALYVTVDSFGTGTFKFHVDGYRTGGIFTLNPAGPTDVRVFPGSSMNVFTLTLDLLPGTVPTLQGTVHGGIDPVTFVCVPRAATQVSEAVSGQYNIALTSNIDLLKSPFGFAIVQVEPSGNARITGRLPNGKAWSATSAVDEVGGLSFQTSIPRTGSLSGMINVNAGNGKLAWIRPEGILTLNASGGRFQRQTVAGLNVFGDTQTRAIFKLGSPATSKNRLAPLLLPLGDQITTLSARSTPIRVDGRNRVAQGAAAPPLVSMKVTPDGRFSGTYKSRATVRFSGILQSSEVRGVGVITSGQAGYVLIDRPTQVAADPPAPPSTSDTAGLTKTGAGTLVIAGADTSVSGIVMNWVEATEADRATALSRLLLDQSSAPEKAP